MSYHIVNAVASIDENDGGPSRSVPQAGIAVSTTGVQVDVFALKTRKPIKYTTTRCFKIKLFSLKSMLLYILKRKKIKQIDLFHIQGAWHPFLHFFIVISKWFGIPYLLTPRGMLEPWILNRNIIKKKIALLLYQKKDYKNASCIHVTSKEEYKNIRNLNYKGPIAIIPNGIDFSNISSKEKDFGSRRLVFISRIHPKKGLENLINAWSEVMSGWELHIAGDGDTKYINQLKSLVEKKGFDNISFVGPKYGKEKWEFIKSGDALILPSYSENFGIVVAEALAVGVPVIASKGTPWSDLHEYNCGWWVDNDIDSLKNVLNEVSIIDIKELKRKGDHGKIYVEENYSLESVGMKTKNLYDWMLGIKNDVPDYVLFE